MAYCRTEIGISNMVIQCSSLASILEDCLGPRGRAVLMEKAGCVVITQDGAEILTSLDVCDPVVNMVVHGILDQTKVLGDGCKVSFLLLRRLLHSLDSHVATSSCVSLAIRRQRMVQITQHLRKYVKSTIIKDVIRYGTRVYPLHSFEAFGKVLQSASESFFQTKFSKLVARNLSQLLSTYLFCNCSNSEELIKLLNDLATNVHIAIVQVYKMPLSKSRVISGFVLTRNFKYLHEGMKFDNVSSVLWSIDLEERKDNEICKPIIETGQDQTLIESIFIKNRLLDFCLASLKSLGVHIIFSSTFFPDWAASQCSKYGFSLIDMIEDEEWNFLIKKLQITPIINKGDINLRSVQTLVKIEPVVIGTCKFVRLHGLDVHQILLCGPTPTQCKQFSTAYCKLFMYLNSWVTDCLHFGQIAEKTGNEGVENMNNIACDFDSCLSASSVSPSEVLSHVHCKDTIERNICTNIESIIHPQSPSPVLYSVPHGGYVELLAKYLVQENVSGSIGNIYRLIISEVLDEIPWLLYKKLKRSPKSYTDFQTRLYNHFKGLRTNTSNEKASLSSTLEANEFLGYQNPFAFFRILDCVFHFTEYILRIECSIPSKRRILKFIKKSEREDSDDE
ncbi:BBSome complex assembly protein BBS10 isoform X2 [Procambarus clarkii]|nr:uncharacterized protein LOC123746831 isoform X2 [Procambarus clarkii]XP_045584579.1 uncharacterized protein LOC123746831 isoform X2 [Procambarus clarkii]XP_045584580.1 uncharacterized protein LOC123746831 isoform X2 [Procambarus clarkii]